MSRHLSEDATEKSIAGVTHRVRRLERRPGQPRPAVLHIKVFPDIAYPFADPVVAGDGMFKFDISEDMNTFSLTTVEMYVTTVSSSGIVQVQLRNVTQAVDMLTTRVQVDAGEKNSKTAATAYVIDTANDDVAWADEISIDVDAAGTGAYGLGLILEFRLF